MPVTSLAASASLKDNASATWAPAARLQPVLDPARQARLGQTLLGIGQAQVSEDVAAA